MLEESSQRPIRFVNSNLNGGQAIMSPKFIEYYAEGF